MFTTRYKCYDSVFKAFYKEGSLILRTQSLAYKLGVKIRALRKAAGLTQEQLAEAADVSTNFIGYVERGQRALSIKTLDRIARALGVAPKDMFEFREDEVWEHLYEALLTELRKCSKEDFRVLTTLAQRLSSRSSNGRSASVANQVRKERKGG